MSAAQPQPSSILTVKQAREFLRARLDEGASCPTCLQHVQVYRRQITSTMAYVLVLMYRYAEENGDLFFNVPRYLRGLKDPNLPQGSDETKLKHWELIEAQSGVEGDDGNPRTGLYRITERGKQFVRGELRVPKYARIYNGKLLSLSKDETVSIREALGKRFRYSELMNNE